MQEKIVFSATQPETVNDLPISETENCFVLVFECVPHQYRMVVEWFENSYKDSTLPVFRYVIPCGKVTRNDPSEDQRVITDLGDYLAEGLDIDEYRGRFSHLPPEHCYEVAQIKAGYISDMDPVKIKWPRPTQHSLSGFYRDGHCSLHRAITPRLQTGLSRIQELIIDYAKSGEKSANVILHRVANKVLESVQVCEYQLYRLSIGNMPFLSRREDVVTLYNPAPSSYLPLLLFNGDYPIDKRRGIKIILDHLKYQKELDLLDREPPCCSPYLFKLNGDGCYHAHLKTNVASLRLVFPYTIYPQLYIDELRARRAQESANPDVPVAPYPVDVDFITMNGKVYGRDTQIQSNPWKVPISPAKVVINDAGEFVAYNLLSSYVRAWIDAFSTNLAEIRPDRYDEDMKREQMITTIMINTPFDCRLTKEKKREFTDRTRDKKRAYIASTYGEKYVDKFMAIPIGDVGPEIFDNIHDDGSILRDKAPKEVKRARLGDYYNAKTEIAQEIEALITW